MLDVSLTDITLVVVGSLAFIALAAAGLALVGTSRHPLVVNRARRRSALRSLVAVGVALAAFAFAVLAHRLDPRLQSIPYVLGPLVAAAAGLIAFRLMPTPSIDAPTRRRAASVDRRTLEDYSTAAQRRVFQASAVTTVLIVVVCGVLSRPSLDGRWICPSFISAPCAGGGALLFPGWMFGVPALVLSAAVALSMRAVLRQIVDAPAASWPELSPADGALRVGAIRLVYRVTTSAFVLAGAMFLGVAAFPFINAAALGDSQMSAVATIAPLVGWLLFAVTVAKLLWGAVLAVIAVVGAVRLPRAPRVVSLGSVL
ncbi:hypothetical protein [Marisediminicola sp. LYQ85]|uniref:hypothetical protein n=1 Tax=Marisediminicola sp. LYQ85 TaxID=3391062 RepID=UPI003982F688